MPNTICYILMVLSPKWWSSGGVTLIKHGLQSPLSWSTNDIQKLSVLVSPYKNFILHYFPLKKNFLQHRHRNKINVKLHKSTKKSYNAVFGAYIHRQHYGTKKNLPKVHVTTKKKHPSNHKKCRLNFQTYSLIHWCQNRTGNRSTTGRHRHREADLLWKRLQ